MNTYKISFSITKQGFFSDTKIDGIEYVKADSEKEAYDIKQKEAKSLSYESGHIISITNIEKIDN